MIKDIVKDYKELGKMRTKNDMGEYVMSGRKSGR